MAGATVSAAEHAQPSVRHGRIIGPYSFDGRVNYERYREMILTPLDFLCGFSKSLVYRNSPRTFEELRENIEARMKEISGQTLLYYVPAITCSSDENGCL